MRVAKLVDDINLEQNDKKYNPVEVILESDNSDASDCLDLEVEVTLLENLANIRLTIIL